MVPPRWFRLVRSGVFASVCVALSRTGHDLMAARAVPIWATWTALAAVTAVGYCLADRRRSAWWILLAVEVVQFCLHLWFSSCTPGASSVNPGMAMQDGMHAHTVLPMPPGGGGSAGMLGAHALAGVLVTAWLYAGERVLWRTLGAIAGLLPAGAIRAFFAHARGDLAPDRGPSPAVRLRGEDETALALGALRHALVRRGPPPEHRLLVTTAVGGGT